MTTVANLGTPGYEGTLDIDNVYIMEYHILGHEIHIRFSDNRKKIDAILVQFDHDMFY